jgi:murein DD-endopeptidase MepM/ murein hydrolase activator NlpD
MNDIEFRRSTSPRRSPKKQVVKESNVSVITMQVVVSILLIITAIVIKFSGGTFYKSAQSYCKIIFKNSITMSDVAQVYNNFKSVIPNTLSSQNSSSSKYGTTTSGSKTASNISSGASQGSSSTSSSTKTSTSSNMLNSLYVSSSNGGAGGLDISLNIVSQSMVATMQPPNGCTLAPVMLSVKPIIPVLGRITSKFGYRIHPVTKKLSFHTGIDIANDEGSPIAAALSGIVKDVGNSAAYGNYVLMDNGGGIETFYGHCEAVIAPKGAVLRAGDIIAKLGSTGISTGPHLHFEIRVNNIYTNPLWNLKIADFDVNHNNKNQNVIGVD